MEDVNEILKKINGGEYKLKKNERSKSVIWNVFSEIQKEDGSILEGRVYCQGCHQLFKFTKKQTSNLIKHKCVHLQPHDTSPVQVNTEDKNACFEVFMDFLIEDCRPFSTVEGSGFRKMIAKCLKIGAKYGDNVDLEYLIPSARTLSRKTKTIAEEQKQAIKPHIQDLVSNGGAAVTIDLWTDNFVKRNFLCATLHFQINYKLVDITLGMKSMDFMSSTGKNIKDKLSSVFVEFGVTDISNVVFVTDRGSNVISALKEFTRLNCSAHLFSNVLNDAFESTLELNSITDACKKTVKYFKKSNKQHMLNTTLKSSCPTRWNSNFAMYESVFDNYAKVNEILADNAERRSMLNFNITVLQSLVEICNDFEIIFKQLQYSKLPTLCFVIPSINKLKMICTTQENDEAPIAALKINILSHLEKWHSNLSIWHKAAVFLYPPAISLQPNDINTVKTFCIEKLLTENDNEMLSDLSPTCHLAPAMPPDFQDYQTPSTSGPSTSTLSSQSRNVSFFFPSLLRNTIESSPETVRDEVERYSTENVRLTEDFDVMLWWKNNCTKYPRLSKLAMNLLSIPASSAASERVFSLAGNVITEKRNRLEPKTVDSILFLNSLYKQKLW